MPREMWRDIIDFEGLYKVSYWGCVKSSDRVVPNNRGGVSKLKGKILRPVLSRSYLVVVLCKGGKRTNKKIHRIVAEAWLGLCPDGFEVCHGPSGQLDNSVYNLRYGTRSDNQLDKRRDGTDSGRPIRRSDGVEFIRISVAAKETGCNQGNISKVCKGKRKSTGGFGWEYIDV